MNHSIARALIVTALLTGCAQIPKMTGPNGSGIAVDLALKAPLGPFSNKATQVIFARIDNADGILQQLIVRSNYTQGGRAYLLNARPGTYVMVAAIIQSNQNQGNTTYFSRDIVEQSKTVVAENDLAFVGSYVVQTAVGFSAADDVQTHYKNVIDPGGATGVMGALLSGSIANVGTLHERKDATQALNEFRLQAAYDLEGSEWAARVH